MRAFLTTELKRARTANPFEVLAVPLDADSNAIRQAFLAKTKLHHPQLYARADVETRELATELFLVIRAAYEQLSDDNRRKTVREKLASASPKDVASGTQPPKSSARPTSQITAAGSAPQAAPPAAVTPRRPTLPMPRRLTVPVQQHRPTAEVQAMMDSARTRTKRYDDGQMLLAQGRFREAREAFFKLAAEDPAMKKYRVQLHFAWGLEYGHEGKIDEAMRELERASALEPDNADIADALRKLGEQKKPGGILSKLFGR